MTKEQINRIYVRTRLRYVMQDCLISDELVKEVRQMLEECYKAGEEDCIKTLKKGETYDRK